MKALTQRDLPVLAEIIREATHRKVIVFSDHLDIMRNNEIFASIAIRGDRVLATKKIPALSMEEKRAYNPKEQSLDWLILI